MDDTVSNSGRGIGTYIGWPIFGIVALLGLSLFFGSWYTVDEGNRAVVLTNGKAATEAEGPGLHFKVPFFQTVKTINLRQQVVSWTCERPLPGQTAGECPEGYRWAMEAYSKDSQPADMRVTINWRIVAGKEVEFYSRYGADPEVYANQTIARVAPEALKEIFGQYTAYTVISDRAKFNAAVSAAITVAVSGVAMVDSVQVEDIKFAPEFEKAVTARMEAEVAVAKRKQDLETEKVNASIAVTQAQAAADSRLAVAKADAEAIRVKGEAEADAIKARAAALAANAALVELTKAERWDGKLPTTVIPNGTVPFLDAGPKP